MNKIENINLGGYPFQIDDDALEYLKLYLENIKRRFSESDGRDEIMRDVETRLGELISQYMGTHTIVMLPHVESAVQIMGKPEDFGGDEVHEEPPTPKSGKKRFGNSVRTGKKMFRDEEDAVIAGVCSGLAAYFGFQESLWMRVIFVFLAFVSAGFWVPVYVLLWIIVPPARTAGERLAMKGEAVNVDNIAKEFEKGYERISRRVAGSGVGNFNTSQSAQGCLNVLGKIALGFLILFVASMVFGLGTAWVAGIIAFFTAQPLLGYFSPLSTGTTYFWAFCLFLVMGLPLVGLTLWMARTIFKTRTPGWLRGGLSIFWVFSLLSLVGLSIVGANRFRAGATVVKTLDLSNLPSDTLRVDWDNFTQRDRPDWEWPWDDADIYIDDERIELRDFVRIHVRPSTNGRFECRQEIRARGANSREANENATQTEFSARLEGSTLKIPNNLFIAQGHKWFGRTVSITISVPPGKSFVFSDDIYHYASADLDDYADDNDNHNYISRSPGTVFVMTSDGIRCSECPAFGDEDYDSDRNYSKFVLEGDYELDLRKGNKFIMKIEGDKNDVQVIRTGDKLTLTNNGKTIKPGTKILIETPDLESLLADNTGQITIRGFEQHRISLSAKGKSAIKANIEAQSELEVLLSGQSSLEVTGEGHHLSATLSGESRLEATNWQASEAVISASGNSKAHVFAKDSAEIKSDPSSEVRVEGTDNITKR